MILYSFYDITHSSSCSVLFLTFLFPYYHPCSKFLPFSRPLSPPFPSRLSLHLCHFLFTSLSLQFFFPLSLLAFSFPFSCFVLNTTFLSKIPYIRYCIYVLKQIRQETLDQLRLAEISGLLNSDCRPSQPAWIGYVVSVSHSMLLPMPCLFGSIQHGYTAYVYGAIYDMYIQEIYTTGGTVGDYLELRAV